MSTVLKLRTLLVCIAAWAVVSSCGNTSTVKSEKIEGVEWNVSVCKVLPFNDTRLGIDTDFDYTLSDTARVNAVIKELQHCGNITIGWTLPSADGSIWLVAYENEPLLSETVVLTEANSMPSYGGNIQVAFKFSDAQRWAAITGQNIGQRLAVIVNGQLMNAPQVNAEISSGNCSVSIPAEKIRTYLPTLDL